MADAQPAIGVDLGGTKMAAAVVEGADRITFSSRRPTLGDRGPEPIIHDLVELIRDAVEASGQDRLPVGVAVCGQVASRTGVVRASPNLAGWREVPLRARLEEALGMPVSVANDGHLIALGEWLSAPDDEGPLVAVYVGTGVGCGVVIEGHPLLGHAGYAAELGHMTIVVDGRPCRCGNRGCLEAYAGGWAVGERTMEAAMSSPADEAATLTALGSAEGWTAHVLARAYAGGDRLAGRLVREIGRDLGAGLVGIVNVFNPRRVVLGGGVVEGIPDIADLAVEHLQAHALEACLADLTAVVTSPALEAGVLGAAALARSELAP